MLTASDINAFGFSNLYEILTENYDAAGRLSSVDSRTSTPVFSYQYAANLNLISSVSARGVPIPPWQRREAMITWSGIWHKAFRGRAPLALLKFPPAEVVWP